MTTAVDATQAVVTLAETKEYLKISTSNEDAIVSHLINAASAWVQGYLKREIVSKSRTEYYSGDGTLELALKNYPVISIDSIYIDQLRQWAESNRVDTANVIVKKDQGIIRAFNLLYGWTGGESNIKITYTAGYVAANDGAMGGSGTMPYDIRMATKRIIDLQFRIGYTHRKLDYASESISGMNITFKDSEIPKDVKSMLDGWKKTYPCPQYEYAD